MANKIINSRAPGILIGFLFFLIASSAGAQMNLYLSSVAEPVKPGEEFTVTLAVDVSTETLGKYEIPIVYNENLMIFKRSEGASGSEFTMPIVSDIPFNEEMVVMDEHNSSQGCSSTGYITLAHLTFQLLGTAPPGTTASIGFGDSVMLLDCYKEDITGGLPPPSQWEAGSLTTASLPTGAPDTGKYMDLDDDYVPTENDAELLRKIVNNSIGAGYEYLYDINARSCDLNGNAVVDKYDSGRMDALVRPSRVIHAGTDGICQTVAMGDDLQVVPPSMGEPGAVVVSPGFNQVIDSTPGGDDTVSGHRILTGPDGLGGTTASGDDVQEIPFGNGRPNGLCILPGRNQLMDSTPLSDDVSVEDDKEGVLVASKPQTGAPASLELIRPEQDPLFLDRNRPVPITVAVKDQSGSGKTGISPVFRLTSGAGYFQDGQGGTTVIQALETDVYTDKSGTPTGYSTVVLYPLYGPNNIRVSLPADPNKGVTAPPPVNLSVEVLDQSTSLSPNIMTLDASETNIKAGETAIISITVTEGNTPVHGLANRIKVLSLRNAKKGEGLTDLGGDRPSAIFQDRFEDGDISDWYVESNGGEVQVDSENFAIFGSKSVKLSGSGTASPVFYRYISTDDHKDIQLTYQYSFIGNCIQDSPEVLVEYSLDGSTWRQLRKADSCNELLGGTGAWFTESINLNSIKGANNNDIYIKFKLNANGSFTTQSLFIDNVGLAGLNILNEAGFETYQDGDFPSSVLQPSHFISTGDDGVLDTTAQNDDVSLFSLGNGEAYSTIIYPGLNGTLDTTVLGDDTVGSTSIINSGPDGVADSLASGDDFQEIPQGQGRPWSHGIYPGSDLVLDSTPSGDDFTVGETGPDPRVEVDSSIGNTTGPGQGSNGSDKFLFLGRSVSGSSVDDYSVAMKLDLEDADRVMLSFYSRTRSQADLSASGKLSQEFVVEVSDNGGKSWSKVWDFNGSEETSWTFHKIMLYDDPRFNLVDDFLVRWRASMDSTEDSATDPDGVYLDDVLVTSITPSVDRFSHVVDTNDGQGTYKVYYSTYIPGDTVEITAAYYPAEIDLENVKVPLFAQAPLMMNVAELKAEPDSIQVLPQSFTLKACQSMNVTVVGRYTDTPAGQLEDMTRFFRLLVNGPARQTGPGVITADCFLGDAPVPIKISAKPLIPTLYDPGGGGSGEQTGDVSGSIYTPVYSKATDAPVWLDLGGGDVIYSKTNSSGHHYFQAVPAGSGYSLHASKKGYTKKVNSNVSVSAGENTTVSFALQSGANFDGDAYNDSTDSDDDDDGVPDSAESLQGSTSYNPDTDGDGYTDDVDAFPGDSTEWLDTDDDGTGDNADTDDDDDGISDTEENSVGSDGYITDPKDKDTDDGGEEDGDEVAAGRDPTDSSDDVTSSDTDGDGLLDSYETDTGVYISTTDTGSDPNSTDTDGDGLGDYAEVYTYNTDPNSSDSDSDGLGDSLEGNTSCTDPNIADTDGDGLTDGTEDADGDGAQDASETDPCDSDSDDDGMNDGYESNNGLDPLSDDASGDLDGDSLSNMAECTKGTYANDTDTDDDGMTDGWEATYESCGLDPLTGDSSSDADSDGYKNLSEFNSGTNPCSWDTDSDGLGDSLEGNTSCTSALLADSDSDGLNDGVEDGNTNGVQDGSETNPCSWDTDSDGLGDSLEGNTSCTSALLADSDSDGLNDGVEDGNTNGIQDGSETNPCDSDSDDDTIPDGYESSYGLDPLSDDAALDLDGDSLSNLNEYGNSTYANDWDSDDDNIPDGFEVLHAGDTLALNPLDASDGNTDFDGDYNFNNHEYWNGTDPWTADPIGHLSTTQLGCAYWGEGNGNAVIDSGDISELKSQLMMNNPSYSNVIPSSYLVQDLNANSVPDSGDLSILKNMVMMQDTSSAGSFPTSLTVLHEPGSTVSVGSTCSVSVGVVNANSSYTPGMAVVFQVGDSTTGSAELLGGDGNDTSSDRYDFSDIPAQSGRARIYLRIESAGTIEIEAKIPSCGTVNEGRYCPEIELTPSIKITAQ